MAEILMVHWNIFFLIFFFFLRLKLKKFLEKKMKKNVDKLKIAADQGSDGYLCFIKMILNIENMLT